MCVFLINLKMEKMAIFSENPETRKNVYPIKKLNFYFSGRLDG